MQKILLLIIILFVSLTLIVSCIHKDDQEIIAELETRINELEDKNEQLKTGAEQKPEGKEESMETEDSGDVLHKEFSPTIIGSLYDGDAFSAPSAIYVIGDYAYKKVWGGSLGIIDITDKNNPTIISTVGPITNVNNFYVEGDYAYITYSIWDDDLTSGGSKIEIIDITDKKKPSEVGVFESDGSINSICAVGNYIYATYDISEQQEEGYYMTVESGIKIIDMTDKENLVSVGTYNTGDSGVGSLRIVGDYIYLFDGQALKILDISDKENPADIGIYRSYGWASNFYIEGDYAYLPYANSLQIIDISDKENPTMAGGAFAPGEIQYVFVEGDYAYITYRVIDIDWNNKESGMQIIDIKDKNVPTIVADIEIPGEAEGIFVKGNYAYVGAGSICLLHILKL